MVSGVEVVVGAQAVGGVKLDLLVDAGVAQQVQQHLLRHAQRAEVLHL